jgi:hypothetical protein
MNADKCGSEETKAAATQKHSNGALLSVVLLLFFARIRVYPRLVNPTKGGAE